MNKIKLLDCTLRDGGYVNDWKFGQAAIMDIKLKLEDSGADIIELGFLKDEPENPDRTIYKSVGQITPFIGKKKPGISYAAMIDVQGRIPIEMVAARNLDTIDIIRVIVWKRTLETDIFYCKQIVERGYRLCVQPARVDQYSDSEFVEMLRLFEPLDPLAIYVVDSWGTQNINSLAHYFDLADSTMKADIALGYHGHNNLQQAFGVAESFLGGFPSRAKIIDASIFGIGRGAGNLNTETIALLLNRSFAGKYEYSPLIEMYDKYIKVIYENSKWGYSLPLYITAANNCNPEYALYCEKLGLSNIEIASVIKSLSRDEKTRYNSNNIDTALIKLGLGNR